MIILQFEKSGPLLLFDWYLLQYHPIPRRLQEGLEVKHISLINIYLSSMTKRFEPILLLYRVLKDANFTKHFFWRTGVRVKGELTSRAYS